jgi:hypothetical protein
MPEVGFAATGDFHNEGKMKPIRATRDRKMSISLLSYLLSKC